MASGEVKAAEELGAFSEPIQQEATDGKITSHRQDFVLRTSWFALTLQLLPYAVMVLVFHVIFSAISSHSAEMKHIFWQVVEPISLLLRVGLLLELIRRYFDRVYQFSRDRVTDNKGKFGLSLQIAHIRYADIREVRLEQGLIGRILNFGSLKLSTASSNDYEVKIENVDNVKEVMREVNLRRKALSKPSKK